MCFPVVVTASCGCTYHSCQPFYACSILVSNPTYHHATTMCPDCTRRELDRQAMEEAGFSDDEMDYGGLQDDMDFEEQVAAPAAPVEKKVVAEGDRSKPWESTNTASEMSTAGTQLYGAEPLPEIGGDGEVKWVFV